MKILNGNCLITNMFMGLLFTTKDMKKRQSTSASTKFKCSVHNVLHLVLLVKMNNINLKTTYKLAKFESNSNYEECV